ncbi:prolyl-tRNA synthetase associated domain-containing protein [Xylanibacter caecicola]|uniref:prolyl-tRNA synthetase associated domain-containing protein n=1 Tax=Xylanibacter caecicola TaxID=2736294 RepID=UPI002585D4F2|nr:prolyl-tRNA synthetase associated domain-containing protein [Xylanibacter caecicola]
MLTIYKGRPEDFDGRQERERRVYELLDGIGVEYDRLDHEAAMTMEVCAEINAAFGRMTLEEFKLESSEERTRHAIICKNLFLCNKQRTRFYLLMIPGDKKFLTKNLSAQINSARLSFAGEEDMLRYLDITPGSVSVMGLMNDKDNAVQLLIDSDVLKSEYVGCHPCINTSSLRMRTRDLIEKILPAIHHEPIIVTL